MSKTAKNVFMAATLILGTVTLTSCSNQATKQVAKAPQPVPRDVLVYRLQDMDNKVADHDSPDAMVYISPLYDKTKPIHLIVYNHGMMTNLDDVESGWQISKAMQAAAPNTVLIAPEWAVRPHDLGDKAGKFHSPGFFKSVLTEAFSKTPELKGRSLNDISDIALTSFSGGLYPLCSELTRNGIGNKVTTIAVFDSLYKGNALDGWLHDNAKDLATGKKQYYNFWFHCAPQSLSQLQRVKRWLAAANADKHSMRIDLDNANDILPAERIATRPVVFKSTNYVSDPKFPGHPMVAKVYIPLFIKAHAYRQTGMVQQLAVEETKAKRVRVSADGTPRAKLI